MVQEHLGTVELQRPGRKVAISLNFLVVPTANLIHSWCILDLAAQVRARCLDARWWQRCR